MIDYDPHRWWQHFFDIKGSMVREIFYRVLFCVLWSAVVVAFHQWVHPVAIPQHGHTLVGFALGLLLVFRTQSSYDRFWEGRKQWGAIVNETRNLARLASVLLADAPALLARLLQWTVAFPYAVMHQLRGSRGLGPIADCLPTDEAQATLGAEHPPLAVARRISEQIAEARHRGLISDYTQMTLDQNVQLLVDYMGACERIHKTPLPFAYVVHLRRALILYCYSLPFALLRDFGWETVAVTFVIAYILFGIEEIGVEIEDPFGSDDNDLPLERICATIEGNLRGLLNAQQSDSTLPIREGTDQTVVLQVGPGEPPS
ncbi:MAG TPA: bestrophin family ion channel [Gemmataceae bacterium]|nr:bestrophin family ion channel [Gemmataceae bacterium]